MYVPSHYAALFAFFFLMQSTVIFVYTIIGLLKANPLPFIMPPAPFPMAQSCPQLLYPAIATLVPGQEAERVTTTIYATITAVQKQLPGLLPPNTDLIITPSTSQITTSSLLSTVIPSTSTSTVSGTASLVTSVVLTTKVVGSVEPTSKRSTVFLTTTVAPKPSN